MVNATVLSVPPALARTTPRRGLPPWWPRPLRPAHGTGLRVVSRTCLFAVIVAAISSAPAAAATTCGGAATAAGVGRPEPWRAWRARLSTTAPVYPRLGGPPTASVTPADASALLVLAARERAGRCWVRVRLPSRPNRASGWVNAQRLELSSTTWRLVVHVGPRRLDVLRHGRLVRRVAIVVGAPVTPTPRGLFAVAGVWKWRPRDFLGAWVLTLTAHSDVLKHFDGGDGRVALHGRGGASLTDPLGSARSHGCVRIANSAISWLARIIGPRQLPGTPVVVD